MANQSVNNLYTRFFFKIDSLPQDVAFPLEFSSTFFNNLSPNVTELLILEGVQVPPRPSTEKNHQVNQRLLLFRNSSAEAENNIITIKAAVKPEIRSRHPRTFVGLLG